MIPEDVTEDDLAVLMYTSGSTSRPKPVMLGHNDLSNYIMSQTEVNDGVPKGAGIMSAPNYHIAGLTGMIISIFGGRRLVILPQFDSKKWLETVEKEKCTHAFLVPTMMKHLLDDPGFDQYDLSSLEVISYGSAPMPAPIIEKAIDKFPMNINFINSFGMTETTSTVTVLEPEDHRLVGNDEVIAKKRKRLRSVGKPLPDVQIRIMDDKGNELPQENAGHVEIYTSRTMRGYLGDEKSSNAVLKSNGWIRTDDMGFLDDEGYLFLVGRKDDMIIRGGENISPAEVEDVISRHPIADEVAVIGVPSLEWGEEVMAVIVPKSMENLPSKEEIVEFCRERMASYKKPKYIEFVEELPRNSTGKILKKSLKEQYKNYVES
jgi:acyl-CoA synthetase (AMP-forming)/AMP-acid ligase II